MELRVVYFLFVFHFFRTPYLLFEVFFYLYYVLIFIGDSVIVVVSGESLAKASSGGV